MPTLLGSVLSSNQANALPNETLQVVAFYDGVPDKKTGLWIEYRTLSVPSATHWIEINNLNVFGDVIETREYHMPGEEPTGEFQVINVVPNGVIDGLAFGLYWKDAQGNYHVFQSMDQSSAPGARFVGAWPLGMDANTFAARTPQLSGFGREQAKMLIYGAKLLDNGYYNLTIL